MNWHTLSIENIFERFDTSAQGITNSQAQKHLSKFGLNVLEEKKKNPPLKILLRQFNDFMILILIAAAIIAGIVGNITDTCVILLIVFMNAIIGFVQEYRAEKAMAVLKTMSAPNVIVMRDGTPIQIPIQFLTPGDLVVLETGNIVPADIRISEVHNLKVQESALTGESHAIEKNTAALSEKNIPLGDRKNMVYKGTHIIYGRGQ